jgi:hypothetical protein
MQVFCGIAGSATAFLSEGNDGTAFSAHLNWLVSRTPHLSSDAMQGSVANVCRVRVSLCERRPSQPGRHLCHVHPQAIRVAAVSWCCLPCRHSWVLIGAGYFVSQMLGAFIGGALVYAVYYDAITHWEHGVSRH